MADLPIDPCISRIIIEAKDNNCLREMKIISAVLAIQDPRIRPVDQEKEADEAHKIFTHPQSDFMILLNIWNGFHDVQEKVELLVAAEKILQKPLSLLSADARMDRPA